MREELTITGRAATGRMVAEVRAGMDSIRRDMRATREHSRGIISEFEKIPRRMIVAGGASLALGLTVGALRRGWTEVNAEIERVADSIVAASGAASEFLTMLPAAQRAPASKELIQYAMESPAPLAQIAGTRAAVRSMQATFGFSEEDAARLNQAAEYTYLQRGGDMARIGGTLGKMRGLFPQQSATAIANVYDWMQTNAGFAQEQLQEYMQQVSKAIGPGRAARVDLPLLFSMATALTGPEGTGSRASEGAGGIFKEMSDPQFAKKLRVSPKTFAAMDFEQRLGMVQERGEGKDFDYWIRLFGKEYASRAAFLLGTPEGRTQMATFRQQIQEVMQRPELVTKTTYKERLEEPVFRGAQKVERAREVPMLAPLLEPGGIRGGEAEEEAKEIYERVYPQTGGGMNWINRQSAFVDWKIDRMLGGERFGMWSMKQGMILNEGPFAPTDRIEEAFKAAGTLREERAEPEIVETEGRPARRPPSRGPRPSDQAPIINTNPQGSD